MTICGKVIFTTYLIVAMVMDLKWRKIKNAFIILGLLLGILFQIYGNSSFYTSIIGLLLPFSLLPFYAFKKIGAGDIKLLSVIGFILGLNDLIDTLPYIAVFSVILGLFYIVIQHLHSSTDKYNTERIPLAVAISLGVITKICGGISL